MTVRGRNHGEPCPGVMSICVMSLDDLSYTWQNICYADRLGSVFI